jgi:hypothetical protein
MAPAGDDNDAAATIAADTLNSTARRAGAVKRMLLLFLLLWLLPVLFLLAIGSGNLWKLFKSVKAQDIKKPAGNGIILFHGKRDLTFVAASPSFFFFCRPCRRPPPPATTTAIAIYRP